MSDELERATKRTGEVLASFSQHYVAAYARAMMADSVEEAVAASMGAVADKAQEVAEERAEAKAEAEEEAGAEEAEEKKKEEGKPEVQPEAGDTMYVAKITSRRQARDVDLSDYTRYRLFAVRVSPKGSSIQTFESRYRLLLAMHEDLSKEAGAPKVEFPGKKIFGNLAKDFVQKRQKEINAYLSSVSDDPERSRSNVYQTFFGFEEDEVKEFEWNMYCQAFEATCDQYGVYTREDPEDFDDESTGLTILMCDIVEKEILPDIRSAIWDKVGVSAIRNKLLKQAHKAVNVSTGKAVVSAWGPARKGFKKATGQVAEIMDKQKAMIDEMLTKVVSKITPKLVEALAKATKPPEPEKDALAEAGEIQPTLDKLAVGRDLMEHIKNDKESVKALKALQKDLAGKIKAKKKLDKDIKRQVKQWKDVPEVRNTLESGRRVVMGVLDLWLTIVKTLLQSVQPFFAAKDKMEASKDPKNEWASAEKEIAKQLKSVAISVATQFDKERKAIVADLAGLSRPASKKLRKQVVKVPCKMLDFLAQFRMHLRAAMQEAFSGDVDADAVQDKVRSTFLAVGQETFNKFFAAAWNDMVVAVFDAVRQTLVAKLEALAAPVLEPVLDELGDIVPEPLAKAGVDLPGIVDNVVDSTLTKLATKALVVGRRALEAKVFAPDEEEDDDGAGDDENGAE